MKWPKWFPWDAPALRWGVLHPFGPPAPGWGDERRAAWFEMHGKPWEAT